MINNKISNIYKIFLKKEQPFKFSEKASLYLALNRLYKRSRVSQKNAIISENIQGFKIFAYCHSTLLYLINEIFISGEYSFKTTSKKPLIIDCGANIGISVLYFKKTVPNCRIIAFEPNPYAFKLLNENIKENNIKDVQTHEIALYFKESSVPFFIKEDIGTPSASIRSDRGGETQIQVKTKKLSTTLNDLETVDLVKMDVEGAEFHIIKDLVETVTIGKVKNYYIEYHHNLKADKSNLSSFLKPFEDNGFSYKIRGSFRNQKGKRFQNVFIHFFKDSSGSA